MVKLACMTLPYMHLPFERALEGIARAGYRYVSFGLPHAGKPVSDEEDSTSSERMRELLDRFGLKPVMLVSTGQLAPGEPLERARKRFAFAQALGIDEVLSLGTWGYRSFPHEPLPQEELAVKYEAFAAKFRQLGSLRANTASRLR
ncbi:hypothetical protein N6H14_26055 [Paenibacillus sp. CC-CFT747]|nr:hypothetical protein N6H14_26055 [Paenibacillus sp. CC-CFT747]